MSLFSSLSKAIVSNSPKDKRELIKLEAELGSKIFGPVPKGHRREFFCLDAHTWIWYEEWKDEQGNLRSTTTRYEISRRGVLKVQDGGHYQQLKGQEADRFVQAVSKYYQLVSKHIYGQST